MYWPSWPRRLWFGPCSLCDKWRILPWRTPADPPFFPDKPGRHCNRCGYWLTTGEFR